MKLRIHEDSIRLRLNRREVSQFAESAVLEKSLEWGPGSGERLAYGLEVSQSVREVTLRSNGHSIIIVLPSALARTWMTTDRVEIAAEVPVHNRRLSILVEKEFRRLHGANLDPDLYPNPLEASAGAPHS